jgi:hypothetical protein
MEMIPMSLSLPLSARSRQTIDVRLRSASSWLVLSLACSFSVAGCGKKGVEAEVQAFKDAGRNVSAFTETDAAPLNAKRCQTGAVDGVRTLLCEYGTTEAAVLGTQAVQGWLGDSPTGLSLRRDLVILALSDGGGADPSGKTMASLVQIFRRTGRK